MIAALLLTTSIARAANQEIKDFHFAQCSMKACIEVWADKGYLSQLSLTFATEGPTRLKLTNLQTKETKEFTGLSSSFNTRLNSIALDQPHEGAVLVSLDDYKIEIFPGVTK